MFTNYMSGKGLTSRRRTPTTLVHPLVNHHTSIVRGLRPVTDLADTNAKIYEMNTLLLSECFVPRTDVGTVDSRPNKNCFKVAYAFVNC